MADYDPKEIEPKWQKKWHEENVYEPDLDKAQKPFYNLMMFPYPSAEGLHVGNMYAFTGSDMYGRMKRMQGYDVFEPIGLDGFGIHSENYAMKIGTHPMDQALISEERFYGQLEKIGNGFAWDERLETYKPEYYRWTQWIFAEMFRRGLAYRKKQPVNWCPKDLTVLADEQVENGKCERCGTEVVKKELEQWFFRITAYADRLLANIDALDWSEKVKIAQRNWIGLSDGAEIEFKIKSQESRVRIFTTRPDTLFGATFLVISPEMAKRWMDEGWEAPENVKKYVNLGLTKSDVERSAENAKEKTGEFTKRMAINPVNQKEIPIWVADYVLGSYGTGAIMAVPAHDERDFQFAKKFDLPIVSVISQDKGTGSLTVEIDDFDDSDTANALRGIGFQKEHTTPSARLYGFPLEKAMDVVSVLKQGKVGEQADYANILDGNGFTLKKDGSMDFLQVFIRDGVHVNSDFLDGLRNTEAMLKTIEWLESHHVGVRKKTYRLRDWLISRQRYWGPPIPMIFCDACAKAGKGERDDMLGWYAVADKDLPVLLPRITNFRPTGSGTSPLATEKSFYEVPCPKCGAVARRETDVSDTFLDSAWYYLRYLSVTSHESRVTKGDHMPFDQTRVRKWLPAEMYIGGAEHAVLHLLYVRFIAMVLHEWNLIDFDEPFRKFRAHGLLIKDGMKMSKSKGNVVNPDEYVANFGADTLRMYLMFLAPFEQGGDFRDSGALGVERFLKRAWKLSGDMRQGTSDKAEKMALKSLLHRTIKKVTEDIENLHYNTSVSALMILLRAFEDESDKGQGTSDKEEINNKSMSRVTCHVSQFEVFLKLLAPFAPHITEEIWREQLGHGSSIHREPWPSYDPELIKEETFTLVFQVNGKTRDTISASANITEAEAKVAAFASEKVKQAIGESEVKKIIYVERRLVNIVL